MWTTNEHSMMFRMTTNSDLCDFLSFIGLSPSREPRKMATNINATERNTLSVLCNINSSTVISLQHQHYMYIIIYIRNMKPYDGRKIKTI